MITPSQHAQAQLSRYSAWAEQHLGRPLAEAVVFAVEIPFRDIALDHLTRHLLWRAPRATWPRLLEQLVSVDFAEGVPLLDLQPVDTAQLEKKRWSGLLRNAAFCLRFRELPAPLLVFAAESIGPGSYRPQSVSRQWLLTTRECLPACLDFFHHALTRGRKRVRVFGGEDYFLPSATECPYSWDDVLLDEARQTLVRQDFEHFLERREWFAARRVPWRRGYLFHGPPGNGKTSAVRAMASHPDVSAFSIDFANKEVSDYDVSRMFEAAANFSPGLILLEDFDRVFINRDETEERNCSFSHILNCLDGLASREGAIVVATANHPERLDEAILRRPGRFDRVIHFPLPDADLRRRYFARLRPGLALDDLIPATERMSFAQLREIWLLACQSADSRREEPDAADFALSLRHVKREQSTVRSRLGFEIRGEFSSPLATKEV